MSIYSGFGTRKQEQEYNNSIERLLNLLSQKILELHLKQDIDDQKFIVSFGKVYGSITKLEQNKYLPPKFSESINDLAKKLGFFYEQIVNAIGSNYSTIQMNEKIVKNSSLLNSSKQTLSVQKNINSQKASPQLGISQSPRLSTKNQSKSGISSPKILNRLEEGYRTDKQESTGDELNSTFPVKQKNRQSIDHINKNQQPPKEDKKKQNNQNKNSSGSQNNIISVSQVVQNQQMQLARQNSSNINKPSAIPSVILQPIPLQKIDQNVQKNNTNQLLVQVNLIEESNKYVNLYPSSEDSQQNYELNDHKLKQQNDQFQDKWSKLVTNIYKYQTGDQNQNTEEQKDTQNGNEDGIDPIAQEALNFQIIQKQRQQYYQQQMIKNQQFIQNQISNQKLFNQQIQQNVQSNNQDNLTASRVSRKNAVSQSLQRYQKSSPQQKNNRSTSIANPTTVKVNNRYNLDNSKIISQKKDNNKKLNQANQNISQNTNISNNSTSIKNSSTNLRILPDLNTSQNLGNLNQNNIQIQQSYQFHNEQNNLDLRKQSNNISEELSQQYQNRLKQQVIQGKEGNIDNLNTQINTTKKQQMIYQNREPINYKNPKTEGTEFAPQSPSLPQTNQSYSFSNSKSILNGGKKQKSPYNSVLGYPTQQKNRARRLSNIQLDSDQDDSFNLDQSIQRIYKESKAYSTQHKENKQMTNFNLSQSVKNQNKHEIQIPSLQPQIQQSNNSGFFITPTQQ